MSMAEETKKNPQEEVWKKFVKTHWKITLVVVAGLISAIIGAVFVFLWRTTGPIAASRYPLTLDLWTVGYFWSLFWDLVLWEFLLVVLPVIAAAIAIFVLWWRKLPAEEKQEYSCKSNESSPRKKASRDRGSGVFGFLVTVTWLILIYANGYWDTAFGMWTFAYLINTLLSALLWDLIICGIPATIALIWWLRREFSK